MTPSRRGWWAIFAACAIVVLGAMAWIGRMVLELEDREEEARAEVTQVQEMRLALWRMDSWLAPLLAREAARPWFEYDAFYAEQQAYDSMLGELDAGAVLKRSPLVTFRSPWLRLHFQVAADGSLASPQAPEGNYRDLAEATVLSGEVIGANGACLTENRTRLDREDLLCRVRALEARLPLALASAPVPVTPAEGNAKVEPQTASGDGSGRAGFMNRAKNTYASKNPDQWQQVAEGAEGNNGKGDAAAAGGVPVEVGSLLPLWLGDEGDRQLAFVRRVTVGEEDRVQGILADWPALERELLALAADLVPGASLDPVAESAIADDATGRVLATVPAALVLPERAPVHVSGWTPGRVAVVVTWAAVLISLLAGALTLRAAVETAERRKRFTSAVTHELRTPLTTFRMYTEMLAEGMVEPARREEYLRTLQHESARLGTLVENVLTYARLEEGRTPARRRPVPLGDLVDGVVPPLERRVADADGMLGVEVLGDRAQVLEIDADAVGQVLFNLVDNACKYGRADGAARVTLQVSAGEGRARFHVSDRGQGVPARRRTSVFRPFDRGDRGAGDAVQGVGLGLALARGLARELGGDLILEESAEGATFVLDLPA